MRQPEQSHSLIAVVIRIDKQYNIRLAYFLVQIRSLLWQRRGIDYGGCDIFRRTNVRRDGDLREDWLDLVGDKDILHQARYDARFPGTLVAA